MFFSTQFNKVNIKNVKIVGTWCLCPCSYKFFNGKKFFCNNFTAIAEQIIVREVLIIIPRTFFPPNEIVFQF